MALLQGTCLVLFYQGTNYCQGYGHAWQLYPRSSSSTKVTSLLVPIATYGFCLWYFSRASTKAQVSLLATM